MEKPLLLFDTDMDTNCDDAGALGLILQQVRAGNATLLGVIADAHIEARKADRMHILRYLQAFWIKNAHYAQTVIRAYPRDAMITVLNEDYLFEQYCGYPMALYAELLWDADRDIGDILCETAMMPCVDFV